MKHSTKNILALLALASLLVTCEVSELPTEKFPVLSTESVTNIEEGSIMVQAKFVDLGQDPIVSYGFVWGVAGIEDFIPASDLNEKIELGTALTSDRFEALITFGMLNGEEYYISAYAKTSTHVIYGNNLLFTSNGGMSPVIHGFSPEVAQIKDTITITGENFSSLNTSNIVKFGAHPSKVVLSSPTIVKAIVPTSLTSASVPLSLTTYGKSAQAVKNFSLTPPTISGFAPTSGPIDSEVTLSGSDFYNITSVKFGATPAPIIASSPTQIKVKVPAGLSAGAYIITVTANSQSASTAGPFTVN